ncbi:hypothetical protein HanXRQr2_Chr11g0509831 [Helianthus annuus]|uniref:Uncharacterized protein n=1 Tax=Helianthus annuus TaxID=4232 RepID=A0A251TCK2_HELAN|nr:hypothetical protein HanXRQr2_Chr11g0509831 [Helianthus annuus]KAJ0876668.1 hypothetical protein HanPSC8_Chr11g0491101 [Helianthus annuus]
MFGLIFQHVNLRDGRWKSSICLYIFFSIRKPVKSVINIDYLAFIVGIGSLGIMEGNFFFFSIQFVSHYNPCRI